jgi:hypothetical protein
MVMVKLNGPDKIWESLQAAYVWILLGGVETGSFGEFQYASIIIYSGTILITTILLNVLIAYLSNIFGRLEDQQFVNDLREKSSMVLDYEIIAYFFKLVFSRKVSRYTSHRKLLKQRNATIDLHECQRIVIVTRMKKLKNLKNL